MYFDLHLARSFASVNCYTHFEKNVTYNIALESTTYVNCNVTLDVTLQHRNITFVRTALSPTPAQRTGAVL
jgi:hypothetical protein